MRRVPGLDLLRAAAILWVMWYHGQNFGLVPDSDLVATYGWMGVDLFFVLSGYLIGGQLLKPVAEGRSPDLKDFYLRRAWRILPAYAVVTALYFAVPAFRERREIQPLLQFLTFTENLLIDLHRAKAFSHVWSLCVEEHFYLVAPILILFAARRGSAAGTAMICAAVVVGGIALRAAIWLIEVAPLAHDPARARDMYRLFMEHLYYPTWSRLDGLLAGVALALVKTFRPAAWSAIGARANLAALLGAVGLAASMALFTDQAAFWPTVVGYPLLAASFALLVASAASRKGLIGARPIPGAAPIAAMAYSLYLTHKAIYHLAQLALGPWASAHPALMSVAAGAAAFAGGGLLYLAVERPFLQWRDRPATRPTPQPVEGVAV
jgi:peptidoglycan/LPS O-acetylase OafA/YrhL